jgi:hypothetical protein
MRAAPAADPRDLVQCGRLPSAPGPQVRATQAKTAEHRAGILRPHMPARPSGLPADLIRAQPVALAAEATTKLVVVEVRTDAKPAKAVAATFRYPREAHPRSPERVAACQATQSIPRCDGGTTCHDCPLPPRAVMQVPSTNPNM